MSFGIFTCCLSRAYMAMEKSNNTRLYAVHVQPLYSDVEGAGDWEVVLCDLCGGNGAHLGCWESEEATYVCEDGGGATGPSWRSGIS